ncbi:torsin interacting protein isoform X1 [Megalopta genalis]|uniref:torsin interacting protein isoform X1 n=2 Tax=Megalopta genalis TaxID=115081 RepID=UPI003FD4DF7C
MNDYNSDEQTTRESFRKYNASAGKLTYNLNNSDNTLKTNRIQENKMSFDDANESDNYTDDEDDEFDENNAGNQSFRNFSREITPDCSHQIDQVKKRSCKSVDRSLSLNKANSSYSQNQVHKHPKRSIFSFNIVLSCSIIFIIFVYIMTFTGEATQEKNVSEINETNTIHLVAVDKLLDESMEIIRTKFHNQKHNIWSDIASGIYDLVMYPQKPTIITLFGNEVDTLNCLAQMVADLSSTIVGSNDYFVLTPTDFPNDVGRTINKLRAKITQKQVVVVQDLLNINAQAMRAFHNFCDRQNPLIKKAIYIMTMVVDGYKPLQNELAFIDKQISKQLSGKIDKDVLDPLVTRLTDGVIVPVFPESTTTLDKNVCSSKLINKRLIF